jgi:hypothetical protein
MWTQAGTAVFSLRCSVAEDGCTPEMAPSAGRVSRVIIQSAGEHIGMRYQVRATRKGFIKV